MPLLTHGGGYSAISSYAQNRICLVLGRKNHMGWSPWRTGTKPFPDCQVKINVDTAETDGWVHYLVAPRDERKPDDNHIHIKGSIKTAKYLVAAVKVDKIDVINRRKLIDAINRETGLNLRYR